MRPPANPCRAERIAVLLQSLGHGGEQRTTISLAAAFASAGRQVDLYVTGARVGTDSDVPPGISVRHLELDGAAAPTRLFSSINDDYANLLTQALARDPQDLLFSAGNAMAVAAGVKARMPQLPLVIRASSHPRRPIPWRRVRHRLLEPIRRTRRRQRYSAADLVIAVAEDVGSAVREMAPEVPVVVLPSPVITPSFLEGLGDPPDHPWIDEEVPIALAVGRFAIPKDFPTLLRAFAGVRSQRELRLVLLGDGPKRYRQELVDLARELGCKDDVDFPGWTSNVAGWLAAAAVFVSTSIWEGSPGAVIEALAAGCPIVATDCPGDTRQLLGNGRLGGLAPIGDPSRIAALIERQLDDPPDPETLKAGAAAYFEESAAAAHLEALDRFLASPVQPLGSSRGRSSR